MEDKKLGCLMLRCKGKAFDEMRYAIDPEHLHEKGLENDPHVTVIYGFEDDVNGDDIVEIFNESISVPLWLTFDGVGMFENDGYDVVFLEPTIECADELAEYREDYENLPFISTHPEYNPHLTLGYVKRGMGQMYVDLLEDFIEGEISTKITEHRWVGADGSELIFDQNRITDVGEMLSLSEFVELDTLTDDSNEVDGYNIFDDLGAYDPAAQYAVDGIDSVFETFYDGGQGGIFITESVRQKNVVLKGKKAVKTFSTKKGYKVVDGKEVKMSASEKRNRKLAAKKLSKKAKRKTTAQLKRTNKKRKKSLKKRDRMNVKTKERKFRSV